jgi:hypothetical protein
LIIRFEEEKNMAVRKTLVFSALAGLFITFGFMGCDSSTGPGDGGGGGTAGAGCWVTDMGGPTVVKVKLTDGSILVTAPYFN